MKLLELFKGTGSFGKIAEKKGWKVVSLDNEAKYNPDILTDILKWNYKDLDFIPDIITASPPCATFTSMALTKRTSYDPNKHARVRNADTMKPLNKYAELGDKLLRRTIKIINYFKEKNPKLKFVIENPRGSMYKSPLMKKLPPYNTETTYYCLYGDNRTKRTDFFNNFNLNLKEGHCRGRVLTNNLSNLCDRYRIPPKLIQSIFKQSEENKVI